MPDPVLEEQFGYRDAEGNSGEAWISATSAKLISTDEDRFLSKDIMMLITDLMPAMWW